MKRKKVSSKNSETHYARLVNDLHKRWVKGKINTETAHEKMQKVFATHPEWKHNPPGTVGRMAYIDWLEFTGHDIVREDYPSPCPCGYSLE